MARKAENSSRKQKERSGKNSNASIKNEPTLDLYERVDAIMTEGIDGKPLSERTQHVMDAMRRALAQDSTSKGETLSKVSLKARKSG